MDFMKIISAGIGLNDALKGLTEGEKAKVIGEYIGINVGLFMKDARKEYAGAPVDFNEISEELIDHSLAIIKTEALKSCAFVPKTDEEMEVLKDRKDVDDIMRNFMRGDE